MFPCKSTGDTTTQDVNLVKFDDFSAGFKHYQKHLG